MRPLLDINGGNADLERCSSVCEFTSGCFFGEKNRGGLHLEQCPAKEEAALCPLPQGLGVFGAGWDWGAELRLEFGAD